MSDVKHAEDCNCRQCKRLRNSPVKQRCDCCGMTRMCLQDGEGRTWDPAYCLAECYGLSTDERRIRAENAREAARLKRRAEPPLAWPVIGGPLDGKFAVPADFYSGWRDTVGGRYAEHRNVYEEFNAARGGNRRIGGFPTMIFVHKPLCRGMIRGKDR